jgi:hypothetical protein
LLAHIYYVYTPKNKLVLSFGLWIILAGTFYLHYSKKNHFRRL